MPAKETDYSLFAYALGQAFKLAGDDETIEKARASFERGLHEPTAKDAIQELDLDPDVRMTLISIGTKPGAGSKEIMEPAGCSRHRALAMAESLVNLGLVRKVKPSRGPIQYYCTPEGYQHRELVIAEA